MGARYYEPAVGRWITADKYLGNLYQPLSLNRYLYCENDPVNGVDPSGYVAAAAGAVMLVPGIGQVVAAGGIAIGATVAIIWLAEKINKTLEDLQREAEEERKKWRYETRQPEKPPFDPRNEPPNPKGRKKWFSFIAAKLAELFENVFSPRMITPVEELRSCGKEYIMPW